MPSVKLVNGSSAVLDVARIVYSDATATLREAASVYLGGTLVWSKSTETWIANTTGNCFFAKFTPTVNMSVASFSMVLSTSLAYNYVSGIWLLSGSNAIPVTDAVTVASTGTTFTNVGTLGTDTKWQHTRTYAAGARPALLAGNTYLFHLGDRYASYKILAGSANYDGYTYDWAVSATATVAYVAQAGGKILLSVTAA